MTGEIPRAVLTTIIRQFPLDYRGTHGVKHWMRVWENGRRLAAATGADPRVVMWFALLHDCRRRNNGRDMQHGPRARAYAEAHRAEIDLDDAAFALLLEAVDCHTRGCRPGADITVKTCVDADRLDIGRIGVAVQSRFLYTDAAIAEVEAAGKR